MQDHPYFLIAWPSHEDASAEGKASVVSRKRYMVTRKLWDFPNKASTSAVEMALVVRSQPSDCPHKHTSGCRHLDQD